MLDKLIESTSQSSDVRRRSGFLLTSFTAVVSFFTVTLLYSLFAYNLALGSENLDTASLVAPVEVAENIPETPKPPEVEDSPRQNSDRPATATKEVRRDNIQRTDEVPNTVPTEISTSINTQMARPQGKFDIGPVDVKATSGIQRTGQFPGGGGSGGSGTGIGRSLGEKSEQADTDTPPVMKPRIEKKQATTNIVRTSKILNGEAKYLAKPPYPQSAKIIHAAGAVNVQVTIDENGNVVSANAVNGHPLLRQVAEQAARSSKFNPTTLNDQKVKVTGVIVYNFIAQ